jgi:hypothetical protein
MQRRRAIFTTRPKASVAPEGLEKRIQKNHWRRNRDP